MSRQTVTQAAEEQSKSALAVIGNYQASLGALLPSHIKPETFIRLCQGALRRNKQLAQIANTPAGFESFLHALMDAARLGHEPGTEYFYLVPFGNEIVGIEGYRGVIERMYRAGAVSAVKAELVKVNDHFEWDPNEMEKPVHKVDWFSDRGPVRGAYAYAQMKDGGISRVVVINQEYIQKVRKESKGSTRSDSPWIKWEDAMVLKTVAHRLEPWVPTSAEYRREQLRAIAEADVIRNRPQTSVIREIEPGSGASPAASEPVDAEVVDEPAVGDDGWPEVVRPGEGS
ncbi:recombinase RecT [[Actinomadura] parvosata]|uniref:recombinase RecT n=1 Tax=[Actinomadura] parvosata TaxID=1955412 RepID=UPI00406D4A28